MASHSIISILQSGSISYSNALKVKERIAKTVAKFIVDSFTFEEIIVDL